MAVVTKKKPKPKKTKMPSFKERAFDLINRLPDDATWDDLQYWVLFHQSLERGLDDANNGRVTPHDEVMKELGIDA